MSHEPHTTSHASQHGPSARPVSTSTPVLSRRAFAKGAALAGAGSAAVLAASATLPAPAPVFAAEGSASQAADTPSPTGDDRHGTSARAAQASAEQTIECDVVVVGAGIAGLMAADHLAEQGISVCLLEKGASVAASNWAQCGGPNACETRLQEQEGAWVSLDEMFQYMYGFSNTAVNAKLLKNVLASTGPAINRMLDLGIEMELWGDPYGTGFRGRHFIMADPLGRTDPIVAHIEQNGGVVLTDAAAYAVLMEEGRAVGVQAEIAGTVTDVRAAAVVICTGGFLGNTQMQQEHFNTPVFPLGNTVSDGTGIQMVLDAGGVLDRPFAVLGNECGAVSPATQGWPFTPAWTNVNEHCGYWLFGGLYVDGTGSRFIDEGRVAALPLAVGGEALVRAGKAWVVMDSAYYEACQNEGIYAYLGEPAEWTAGAEAGYYNPTKDNAEAHLQQAIEEGWGCKADTIEEIAETFGLPNLVETVAAYNEACKAGEDPEFYKAAHFLKPVSEPPFYAFEYVPSAWGTNGGVKVDSGLHALDAENNAIAGLYVAGVDTGSMYTVPYYTNPGASVGNAMGSGWFVAEQIAKDLA